MTIAYFFIKTTMIRSRIFEVALAIVSLIVRDVKEKYFCL